MSNKSKLTPAEIAAEVTPERIEAAAKTGAIARLVRLSKAFTRASYAQAYEVELPILAAVTITDYGIRKKNIPAGSLLTADSITIGKRGGLIFHFKPKGDLKCDRGSVTHVEMNWEDVDSVLGDLVDRISDYLGADVNAVEFVATLEEDIRKAVKANPSMHAILSAGFETAQNADKKVSEVDAIHNIPGYASF